MVCRLKEQGLPWREGRANPARSKGRRSLTHFRFLLPPPNGQISRDPVLDPDADGVGSARGAMNWRKRRGRFRWSCLVPCRGGWCFLEVSVWLGGSCGVHCGACVASGVADPERLQAGMRTRTTGRDCCRAGGHTGGPTGDTHCRSQAWSARRRENRARREESPSQPARQLPSLIPLGSHSGF